MPVAFNINEVLKIYKSKGGKTNFEKSLADVLRYIQNDKNINNIDEVAYLLATAKVESDYSLERWEADYLCGEIGVAYKNKPCEKALNYYRSTSGGKRNYYTLGTDNRGLPYFGRGLIQLTGKSNYEKYGNLIGVNLVGNGDRALIPRNSYKIASSYLVGRTFKYVNRGDLTNARKSVNGGTRGLSEVNSAYNFWLSILNDKSVNFRATKISLRKRRVITISLISLGVIGISLSLFFVLKNKTK